MLSYLAEAIATLAANRLRTLLAVLGLVVGVGAVIAIQVLGSATAGAMTGVFQGMSNYTFVLYPNSQQGFNLKSGITLKQVASLNTLPGVREAIAYSSVTSTMYLGHNNAQLSLAPVGADPEFYSQPLASGRLISQADISSAARVCVLSDNAFEKLSPDGSDVTGREIRAGNLRCTVVGVLAKPPSGALDFNFAPDVLVPSSTFARQYLRGSKVYQVQVLVTDLDTMTQTENTVKDAVSGFNNNKFTYQTFDSRFIANQLNIFFGVLTTIVGVIGAISLAVAGIGIMNVLLVSITERTREIGVRKAIGARRGQILLQFLLEAALLAFTGCVLGTFAGLGIGWWINHAYIIKISGVIVPIAWVHSVELAVIFGTVVTLAFGTYPAYRAAGLDPIEALRYE